MKDGRLHIRVKKALAEGIKAYAKRKNTTVNALVEEHLINILRIDAREKDAELL